MLKHVTIASGGVIPRIHPELLVRKKGGKVVLPVAPKPTTNTEPAAKKTNLIKTTNKKAKAAAAAATPTRAAEKGAKKGTRKGKAAVSISVFNILLPLGLIFNVIVTFDAS